MNLIYIIDKKRLMFPLTKILKLRCEDSDKIKIEKDFFVFENEDDAIIELLELNNNLMKEEIKQINQKYKKDVRELKKRLSQIMIAIEEAKIMVI